MVEQKVAVATGATSGLGQWIALGLARAGYHTVVIARDAARGEATQRFIAERARGASTEIVLADLSSLQQVRRAASDIAAAHPRINVLVNNAGLFAPRRQVTAEGRELVLAVNHLAPFVLSTALEAALQAGSPARIVDVGSTASDRVTLDLTDLEGVRSWSAWRTYGRSKLALMMATFERARRLADRGVTVNVVHPGVVATSLISGAGLLGLAWDVGKRFMITPEQGAVTPLHVALSPEADGVTGKYWKRCKLAQPNRQALDRTVTQRLWDETARLAG